MPPPPTPLSAGGVGTGVTESQFLEEGDIFQGSCSFYVKNTFKSEIFNGKKSLEKIFFSVINKNLRILTKNLVTFKKWDGHRTYTFSNFLKAVFHKIYLVHSRILCPKYGTAIIDYTD